VPEQRTRHLALARVLLVAASAFVAVNIWTGAPLLALWIGSRMVSQTTLSMRGVAIVLVVLGVVIFTLTYLLTWLNATYADVVGRQRQGSPGEWTRASQREAGWTWRERWQASSAVERIVVLSVYLAVFSMLLWFFVLAGSPLPE
jgi:hypothetical protein